MTAFITQQGSAVDTPRLQIGTGINDYSAVQIAEPYMPNAPQMSGWANMFNDVDPLWPRSALLGAQDCFSDGAILSADQHRWEWNWPPTGAHRRKSISGIVYDGGNNPVVGAVVDLFNTASNTLVDTATTATDGSFTVGDPNNVACFLVADKTGSPETTGSTVQTVTGT